VPLYLQRQPLEDLRMKKRSVASGPEVLAVAEGIGKPVALRRVSLVERWMLCGKASCACKRDPAARHGPYFSLTREVGGKTKTQLVPSSQVEMVRRQIEAGRVFRDATELFWQECERVADEELKALAVDSAPDAEKGGSKRVSRRRSSPKSKI
jgi:hypothetical protein